jgi:predicted peroxiredoxin
MIHKQNKTPALAILICSPTIDRPELCVTPLVHAVVARAMDCEVEIHFAGPAVRLLVEGVPDTLYPTPAREKSIREFLLEASSSGVSLLACGMARATWIGSDERLIPECDGAVGAATFVARAIDPDWATLVF